MNLYLSLGFMDITNYESFLAFQETYPDRQFSALMSYAYFKEWESKLPNLNLKALCIDSGGHQVRKQGLELSVENYAEFLNRFLPKFRIPIEVITLDQGNNVFMTKKNTEFLVKEGFDPMPVYHIHEPQWFYDYCLSFRKVAVSGSSGGVGKTKMERVLKMFFGKVAVHGLAMGKWAIEKYPFESVDCSTFQIQPRAFAMFPSLGGLRSSYPKPCTVSEIKYFVDMEEELTQKWRLINAHPKS